MSTNSDVVEALRAALKERDRLRKENARLLAGSGEPIAIIGMACRYPGAVDSPEALWRLVAEERDAIGPFPTDRGWDLERLFDPDPDRSGTCYVREGGFLADAAEFDPGFFGLPAGEAPISDPQQRLLLEVSWEALEAAGIVPASLRGSQTGVFAGAMFHDYGWGAEGAAGFEPMAIGGSVLSGRLAYTFGLEGPAATVDTACSSSLVALHLAVQALRGGECALALSSGTSIFGTPRSFVQSSRMRSLAPDGRSKAFAEAADGVGFSEGIGVLALERLSDARRNGHPVLATIRGSAVNQDGASNGLTAPNGPAQERVIRQALANAGLAPAEIDAVEAHGTGTPFGDPIEAGAVLATYGQDREAPLRLGSIKSNIGHAQAAAGVGGVIKTVMAMREGVLPKTLHVDAPSSRIDWGAGEVELLTEAQEWSSNGHPRRAGVSAFGATGTNAHVILEEAPAPVTRAQEKDEGAESPLAGPIPLVLSAKSEPALRESAQRLAFHLRENPELDPVDVAYSLTATRTGFERRGIVLGSDREQLLGGLAALADGAGASGLVRGSARLDRDPVFVFPGYGSQWLGMATELSEASPVFARRMRECTEALEPYMEWPLEDVLRGAEGVPKLDWPFVGTQALFAVTVSLVALWRACGVEPAVVAGHSQGELIAAHVAGGLSLDDAARAVAMRIEAMRPLDGNGGMASIALPGSEVESRLERWQGRISVAALNGPSSTVVSGESEALEQLIAACVEDGVKAKKVPGASGASHSAQVEPLRDDLIEALAPISPRSGEIPFHSTVTGEVLDTAELNPEYWYRNLRQTVRLEPVIRSLIEEGRRTFIEVSPHPVLGLSLQEIAEATAEGPGSVAVLGTLRREDGGAKRFAGSLAEAHAAGANVEWGRFFAGTGAKAVALPTYPFQRKSFWLKVGNGGSNPGAIGLGDAGHPLLQASIEDPEGERLTLSGRVSLQSHPWLADHAVGDAALFPASGLLELALRAGAEAGCERLVELTQEAPLLVPPSAGVRLQVRLAEPGESGARALSVYARPEGEETVEWTCHARGVVSSKVAGPAEAPMAWPPDEADSIDVDVAYDRLAEAGLDHGPAFQGLTAAWVKGGEIFAEVSLGPEQLAEAGLFGIHPALLESVLHGVDAGAKRDEAGAGELRTAVTWAGVSLHAGGASSLRARIRPGDDGAVGLFLADEHGEPVASVDALSLRAVPGGLSATRGDQDGLLGFEWVEATATKAPRSAAPPPLLSLDDLDFERSADLAETARAAALAALRTVRQWLEAEDGAARLAFHARGAVAAVAEDDPDLPSAAAWGLLRSAQSELPGRIVLIDSDGSEASVAALPAALAMAEDEPQLALREGRVLVPRVVRIETAGADAAPGPVGPERSLLVVGDSEGLGGAVARHLADRHGARHVLFAGEGEAADRDRLAALIASVDGEHPLGAVVHAVELIDNGLVGSIGPEQVQRVLEARAGTAWNLHELTRDLDLSGFVTFTAAARSLGGVGQANNTAADAFLDALTQLRRREGLPASTLAWGLWDRESGLASGLAEAEWESLARAGFAPLSEQRGLDLFDAALAADRPLALAAPLDRSTLRAAAADGALPAPLRKLIPTRARRGANSGGALAVRLARVPEDERLALVLDLIRTEVAIVLDRDSGAEIDPALPFKDLGFDSAGAVELRNRLGEITGMRLPATVGFDYPTAAELAGYLVEQASGAGEASKPVLRAQSSDEPIAIVGIACRYPGSVATPDQLWEMLAEGREAIGEFPSDRGWDLERLYHPDPDHPGTSYAREGGFLYDAGDFDPAFFGISPREAASIDPQQRLLLESSWEALEHAGVDPVSLRGTPTGIFAGVSSIDYTGGLTGADESLDGYRLFGASGSVVSGRVSYTFGLEGPAMTVDTACSSSLVAIHLASQALRTGECSLALAGGVSVLSSPLAFTEFSRLRGLSPDGRCKAFSEAADGVAWSEGVGVLVLERLSAAEANGRQILATIRGSAVNQDGASNGMTAPNGPSQERVIRQALANARLEPEDVDAVEAHGTGTMLGDPIEAGALLATYGQDRGIPLKLGSIKSNIGHAQAAAGVGGVIKTVMAMREGMLPKTLHVDAPSSKVDWEAGEIELLTEATEWKPNGRPRRAGVSSFGASGTNVHLILEEAPVAGRDPGPGASAKDPGERALPGPIPLVLSAKTPEALHDSAARLAARLERDPELDLTDLAFSLATTRAQMEQRAAVVGDGRDELLAELASLAGAGASRDVFSAEARSGRLAFLFTGQGSQRPGMGKELYETYPAYAKALDEACEQIDPHLGRSLKDLLFAEPGSKEAELLDNTAYAQPAIFATELALHRLLESFGLKADLLTGHSVGEILAAHVAGVFSLEDAAQLICARGRLMGALPEGGAMLAIEATEEEALAAIEGKEELLSLAAVNSPNATVISGDAKAIEAVDSHFQGEGRKTKRLTVSHAFHSPLLEPMLEEFSGVVSSLTLNEPKLSVISNLTGEPLTPEQATDPAYWTSHARQPVRFADSVATLKDKGTTTFLELGPDAVLTAMAAATLGEDSKAALIPTLREGREEPGAVALSLGAAWASGAKLDWQTFFKDTGASAVPLPTYPFQRKRYWLAASSGASDPGAMGQADAEHPLLSAAIEDPEGGFVLTGRISAQPHPWLGDHVVFGKAILPGTALLELALRAGAEAQCEFLEDLALQAPLLIPETGGVALRVSLAPEGDDGKREVSIHSRAEAGVDEEPGEWALHAQGVLSGEEPEPGEPLGAWPPKGAEPLELDSLYERLADAGLEYGRAFQGLDAAWRSGEEIYAEVSLDEEQESEAARFGAHPALLDPAFHAASEALVAQNEGKATLLSAWAGVRIASPGRGSLRVRLAIEGDSLALAAFDEANAPVLSVASVIGSAVSPDQIGGQEPRRRDLLTLSWTPAPQAPAQGTPAKLISLPELGRGREEDSARAAHVATRAALELIQATLAEETERGGEPTRLVLLTEGAVAAGPGEDPDPAAAAVWGLLRSAQSENPGRFALIDSDGADVSQQAIARAVAASAYEPQLALRAGEVVVPRVSDDRGPGADGGPQAPIPIDPERTVLITGATGTLGALVARHLVTSHGARHLLLTSRSGSAAQGANELSRELQELGAEVRIEACDVASRGSVQELVGSIDPEHPLGAIVHAAGVIEDGIATSFTAEQLDRVLAPKVDGAWNLHELSREMDLSAFVMFSSMAGTIGGPGQGNYAAANVFMDALAQHRRANGLAATSIAWGMWASQSAITGELDEADRARARRVGAEELTDERGLELLDAALERGAPFAIAAPVDRGALARMEAAGMLPPILRGLLPKRSGRRRAPTVSLAERLARVPEAEREATVLELVREEAAAVLGHPSAGDVPPERAFGELGFDSLAAVEMRNRLGALTGVQLPPTIVFDYPNAAALAGFLLGAVGEGGEAGVDSELNQLEQALAGIPADDPQRQALAGHLRALAADLESEGVSEGTESEIDRLEEASDEELLEFIDQQVGR